MLILSLAMPALTLPWPGLSGLAVAKDGGGHGDSGGGGSGGSGSGSSGSGSGSGHGGSGESSGHGSGSSGSSSGNSGKGGGNDGGQGHGRDGSKGHASGGDEGKGSRGRGSANGRNAERSAVVWSSREADAVEVRYGDGWSERAAAGRYTLRDPARHVVASRPARRSDLERLKALAE